MYFERQLLLDVLYFCAIKAPIIPANTSPVPADAKMLLEKSFIYILLLLITNVPGPLSTHLPPYLLRIFLIASNLFLNSLPNKFLASPW